MVTVALPEASVVNAFGVPSARMLSHTNGLSDGSRENICNMLETPGLPTTSTTALSTPSTSV